uniref:Uncharacterized protein n=1 Tax=Fusarium oxysporum (strain Fo5176) TaxID=660025 RepID=A0A0D2XLK8_FUSOF
DCLTQSPRDGMLIPKGSTIFVGVWAMHHDKDYYGSHDTFDPDRYLSHTKLANEYAFHITMDMVRDGVSALEFIWPSAKAPHRSRERLSLFNPCTPDLPLHLVDLLRQMKRYQIQGRSHTDVIHAVAAMHGVMPHKESAEDPMSQRTRKADSADKVYWPIP